jgi:hypothetical protein
LQEKPTAEDGVSLLVWDLNAELLRFCQSRLVPMSSNATDLLNRHDDLDGVKAVKTEVVVEVSLAVELEHVSMRPVRPGLSIGSYLRGILDLCIR